MKIHFDLFDGDDEEVVTVSSIAMWATVLMFVAVCFLVRLVSCR